VTVQLTPLAPPDATGARVTCTLVIPVPGASSAACTAAALDTTFSSFGKLSCIPTTTATATATTTTTTHTHTPPPNDGAP
jgi:hypothetical protein